MKTKIISIVVMLMMACNVMAQYDFMTLHFNNDSCPSRRFYWPDVTKFTQSKYDKDGVLHDSYQTQEIWIRDSIYSYSLMDIDSITFTKFNKEEAKRNFISAMNSTTKLTHGCKTITEVEPVLDQLNGSEGVERAWIDGTTLHVTSINGYTIDFYYDLIKPEEIDTDDSEPYNIPEYKLYAPAWAQDYSYTGYKPRVLLINLLTKDEGFFSRNQKLRELEKAFRECKIETRFIEESRPRISSDDVGREETQVWETTLFEYDKIYYCAHGGYRSGLNFHTINLSYEIGRKLLSEQAFEHEVLDAAYESLDIIRSQYENCTDHDIALGCIETTENNIDYSILSPSITENYFGKYATRDFDRDKDPIVFSGSCHTLDGNNNMAQVFLGRGAKVVLGYHNANHTSLYASKYFYEALLKGKTVKDAFSSIPSSYRIEDDDSEEGGILEPRYSNEKYGSNLRLGNTFTKDVDSETARAEFISNKKVTISGVTGIVNPSDPDIEYGFRYGILKNDLNKTIKASEHHYSTTEPLGNFSFSAKLDMSEYQNYYYQAYTCYDDSYCYGDIYQIIFYLIKEIYLDPTSATLKVGESLTIKATFNPANPPNKELDWESSDPSIATVSHGIVNAKSVGHATITAKATDGSGVTATCEIEVVDDHVNPITLSQTEVTLALGSTTTVEITSGNGGYTVYVDKPNIATATLSGTTISIKGEAKGTAKVTVKDKSGQTAEIIVSVVSSSESYAVYNAGTLTFYHDQLKNSRGGYVFELNTGSNSPGWGYWRTNISKVVFDKSFADARPTSTYIWFLEMRNLTSIEGIYYLNTSEVTNMYAMFSYCENLTYINVSNFDTKNVTDMAWMFSYCKNLTYVDISNFDMRNVTDLSCMFYECNNLTFLDASNYKTEKVTNMAYMFFECNNLTSLDISNFDTRNVTDMSCMFARCKNLTTLDVSSFKTENVTNMTNMFFECIYLTSLDISNFDTRNVTNMDGMFYECNNLTCLDLSNFDTRNVTDMSWMFGYCNRLISLDLSSFMTEKVTNMYAMFIGCEELTSLDISNFDTRNVTDMSLMFGGCENLTSLDVSSFKTEKVTNMYAMFAVCRGLTSLNLSSFDTRNVTDMAHMFDQNDNLTYLDISSFDTRKVTDMSWMFYECRRLMSLDVSNFNMAACENSKEMFAKCFDLKSLAISSSMTKLDEDACKYIGNYTTCSIIAPDGFNFGVDTSGESFTWKSGIFKLDSGNSSILTFTVNGVSFKMVAVEGGTFMMGASDDDNEALSIEKPQHQVTLSSYYIGQVEVTQELWKAVMGTNPSDFKSSNKLPVECVSWDDCQRFIAKLNNLTGETFSLPTEAQWEFAARGGNYSNNYTYSGSNSLDFVAWYNGNSGGKTHNVATKVPNELGIFDMSGNVSEWCQDYYGKYSSNSQTNPTGPSSGSTRIYRGGFWDSYPSDCLIYKRDNTVPNERFNWIGLRLAL